jgi:dsDNA-specific endonuclease/ATPase MutS2
LRQIHTIESAMADETFSEPFDTGPVELPITDVFDMHSVPARDAKGVVEEYLVEAHRLGYKALRIIHGRGIGVQRQMVREILARTSFVESYGDAPAEAGGWGATLVTLRG